LHSFFYQKYSLHTPVAGPSQVIGLQSHQVVGGEIR
jgi:hypothetical protein